MKSYMNDDFFITKGFLISTDKSLLDTGVIYKFLKEESYWSQSLTSEKFNKAIDHSVCFGVYKEGQTIGFARVITDGSNFAYLCDVFIISAYRRLGLSKW